MRLLCSLLLALALLAGACANADEAIDVADAAPTETAAAPTTTAAPTPAAEETTTTTAAPTTTTEPPLVYNLVGGGQLEPGDLAAQDTVLWFWAPW